MVTDKPLDCKSLPSDAEMIPLPREEVTPPVTKIYLTMDWLMLLRDTKVIKKAEEKAKAKVEAKEDFNSESIFNSPFRGLGGKRVLGAKSLHYFHSKKLKMVELGWYSLLPLTPKGETFAILPNLLW